jgi:hypothetical protein
MYQHLNKALGAMPGIIMKLEKSLVEIEKNLPKGKWTRAHAIRASLLLMAFTKTVDYLMITKGEPWSIPKDATPKESAQPAAESMFSVLGGLLSGMDPTAEYQISIVRKDKFHRR